MPLQTKFPHIPPQSLVEGLQVTHFDQFLHTVMVIWKCTDIFRGIFSVGGEGREIHGRILPWRNLSLRKRNYMTGAHNFLALFIKNNEKTNMEIFLN